ncbi:MAG: SdrD B-like domain-containing protein [Deinococcaceae bacterium]
MKRLSVFSFLISVSLVACSQGPVVISETLPSITKPTLNSISIVPFEDINNDGKYQPGEPILQGVRYAFVTTGGSATCLTGILRPLDWSSQFYSSANCTFSPSDLPNANFSVALSAAVNTLPNGAQPDMPIVTSGQGYVNQKEISAIVLPFQKDNFRAYEIYWPYHFPNMALIKQNAGYLRGQIKLKPNATETALLAPNIRVTFESNGVYRETFTDAYGEFAIGHVPAGMGRVTLWYAGKPVYGADINVLANTWTTLNDGIGAGDRPLAKVINAPAESKSLHLKACEDLDTNGTCDLPDKGVDDSKRDRPLFGVTVFVDQNITGGRKEAMLSGPSGTGNAFFDFYGAWSPFGASGQPDVQVTVKSPDGFFCKNTLDKALAAPKDTLDRYGAIPCYPGGTLAFDVFEDVNMDGIHQYEEPPINGLTFKLVHAFGETLFKDSMGKVTLPLGTLQMELQKDALSESLVPTSALGSFMPGGQRTLKIDAVGQALSLPYARPGKILLRVFEDKDKSGVYNGDVDSNWANVQVEYTTSLEETKIAVTDAMGRIALDNVPAGRTVFRVKSDTLPKKAKGTWSGTFEHSILLGSQERKEIAFGYTNVEKQSLEIRLFRDANGDGILGNNEVGIDNQLFTLFLGRELKVSTGELTYLCSVDGSSEIMSGVTDKNGRYVFHDIDTKDQQIILCFGSRGLSLNNFLEYKATSKDTVLYGYLNSQKKYILFDYKTRYFDDSTYSDFNVQSRFYTNALFPFHFVKPTGDGLQTIDVGIQDATREVKVEFYIDTNGNGTKDPEENFYALPKETFYRWKNTPGISNLINLENLSPIYEGFANSKYDSVTGISTLKILPRYLQNQPIYINADLDRPGFLISEDKAGLFKPATVTALNTGNYDVLQVVPSEASIGTSRVGLKYKTLRFQGVVFDDENNDGLKNFNEAGISNLEFIVKGEKSGKTGTGGQYTLNLKADVVNRINAVRLSGISQDITTSISDAFYANYPDGSTVTRHIPVQLPRGSVSGVVFDDSIVKNGKQDAGELVLSGIDVILTDAMGRTKVSTTNLAGVYEFSNVIFNNISLNIDSATLPAAYRPAQLGVGALPINTTVADGSRSSVNIGLIKLNNSGSVRGSVFIDKNGSGLKDPGEVFVSGIQLSATDSKGNVLSPILTGADGAYTFKNLSAGTVYLKVENLPSRYTLSTSGNAFVPIFEGVESLGPNFGIRVQEGSLQGVVFNDMDKDGLRDVGEPGFDKVNVELVGKDGQLHKAITGSDGSYRFDGIIEGTARLNIPNGMGTSNDKVLSGFKLSSGTLPLDVSVKADGDTQVADIGFSD